MKKSIRAILSFVMGLTFFCSSLSPAFAEDYWVCNKFGHDYYVVTEQSSLLDEKSAKARVKRVSQEGSVGAGPYDLYMWEMKGELYCSTEKKDLGTKHGRCIQSHDDPVGKIYDFMMANY